MDFDLLTVDLCTVVLYGLLKRSLTHDTCWVVSAPASVASSKSRFSCACLKAT